MKTPAHFALIKMELKKDEDRYAYPLDPIAEDMYSTLAVALEQADDEQAAQLKADWLKARPHLFKTIVAIPRDELEAAFGASPTLAAQGVITKRYGQASAEAAARSWGSSLGNLKPGRDPDASGEKSAKKSATSGDAPNVSKNPWSADGWRCPRPPKDAADKQRMRLAAQTEIIKNFGTAGAARYAKSAGMTLGGQPLRK